MMHLLGLRLGLPWHLCASTRRRTLLVCSKLQATSAAFLSLFAVIHLSSPLVGLLHLGGDVNDRVDAVSRWMLLGRVAYQNPIGEALLWTSLITHVCSGIFGRLVKSCTRTTDPLDDELHDDPIAQSERMPKVPLNAAHVSGYAMTPVVLHHVYVNRLLPASDHPSIAQLSPSELDYSFVSFSLSHPNTAVRTLLLFAYVALVGAFATHVVYALPARQRSLPRFARQTGRKSKARSKAWTATGIAALLLSSVAALIPLQSRDKLAISGIIRDRYDAVLRTAFPSRFLL